MEDAGYQGPSRLLRLRQPQCWFLGLNAESLALQPSHPLRSLALQPPPTPTHRKPCLSRLFRQHHLHGRHEPPPPLLPVLSGLATKA